MACGDVGSNPLTVSVIISEPDSFEYGVVFSFLFFLGDFFASFFGDLCIKEQTLIKKCPK